jgi:CXXX repeat modification system protein
MQRERVGEVTDIERDEIRKIYERKTALKELFLTLESPCLSEEERTRLQEGLVQDLGKTNSLYEIWWEKIRTKYCLERHEHGQWIIDFQTRELSFQLSEGHSCETGNCENLF